MNTPLDVITQALAGRVHTTQPTPWKRKAYREVLDRAHVDGLLLDAPLWDDEDNVNIKLPLPDGETLTVRLNIHAPRKLRL